ncbi:hypothetical protein FOCC_FOCC008356 [Frankliniella occidentalis]|nr:hypothetical protein FOCC_FOCC008356 [Frankliniella occidentalis]
MGGKRYTTCPILQKHVCEVCGATGVSAHTRSHCPYAAAGRRVSVMTLLKETARKSDGSFRRDRRAP